LATNTQNLTPNEQVLSQSTESQNLLKPSNGNGVNNLSSKLLNSILYNYNTWLQDIIYGVSLVVIGILLTLIFFNFNINFKKQFVLGGSYRNIIICGHINK